MVSSTVGVVLLAVATALLMFGARLVKPVFFVSSCLVAFVLTFFVTDTMLSAASSTPSTSCCAHCPPNPPRKQLGSPSRVRRRAAAHSQCSNRTSPGLLMIVPSAVGLLAGSMAVGLLNTAFTAVGLASGAAAGYVSYAVVFHSLPSGVELLHHDLTYWIW